jgi:hypothetical protein
MYQDENLIDIIIDLQERGFDNDFILEQEHLRWLQYNEQIAPDDFEIIETHHCKGKPYHKDNAIIYAIQLRNYNAKGILLSNYKSYTKGLSLHLWTKFYNIIQNLDNKIQPLPSYVGS